MPEELTTPSAPQPKKKRRKRRSKAEIAAEKAAKAAKDAEAAEMEARGYEKVRARDEAGHFIADDPSTPENEAWTWTKPSDVLDEEDAEKAVEIAFGSSYEADIDRIIEEEECVECNESANAAMAAAEAEVAEEEDAKSASSSAYEEVSGFGIHKIKNRRERYQARSYKPNK